MPLPIRPANYPGVRLGLDAQRRERGEAPRRQAQQQAQATRRRTVASTATGEDENGAIATTARAPAHAAPNMTATSIAIGTAKATMGEAPRANDDGNAFRALDESPRQVLTGAALCVSLAGIAYLRSGNGAGGSSDSDPGASFRSASLAALLLCVSYTFLNARDGGTVTRPHRGLWRILHGCNLWYAGMAAALLVVRPEHGAVVMGWLFPGIVRTDGRGPLEGVGTNVVSVLPDASDGGGGSLVGTDHLDCAFNVSTLRRQIFGLWFFAHCVGWWAKMLMLRDLWTCLVFSTAFELMELTLQVLVPEFQECWWDSVVLDWFVANLCIGMMLGILTHRYLLKWPDFDWAGRSRHGRRPEPGSGQWKAKVADLLAPRSWRVFDWNPENDPVSLVLNSTIWIAMMIGEINSFFLINIFQLPRDHIFNVVRQVFFCLTALPACEEWYEYTRHVRAHMSGVVISHGHRAEYSGGRKPRIGQSAWLLGVTCGLETMAIAKYGRSFDLFSRASSFTPRYWGPWAASGTLFGIYFATHCVRFRRRMAEATGEGKGGPEDRKEGQVHCACPRWLGLLKWASFVPLLFLCRNYAF
mmetsp:Transcript_25569/g.75393  ORF Transcript_25569/g.75393 Transcript_25569/m.75393 type:complete len:585 (+) Transcript_25569:2056-3810(+)